MTDSGKNQEDPVKIYNEPPGTEVNNGTTVELVPQSKEKTEKEVSKKLAEEKQTAKKDEEGLNDTSGEDG